MVNRSSRADEPGGVGAGAPESGSLAESKVKAYDTVIGGQSPRGLTERRSVLGSGRDVRCDSWSAAGRNVNVRAGQKPAQTALAGSLFDFEFSTPAMRNVLATTAPLPASGAASLSQGQAKRSWTVSSSALLVLAVSFGAARNSIVLPIASAGF